MKKRVLTIFAILTLSSAYNVYAQIVSAADLWYPGDIGTTWDYNLYDLWGEPIMIMVEVTEILAETRYYGGKEYKVIKETFPGIIANPFNPDPDPFLVFREDERGRILGYGKALNEDFEEALRSEMVELGARDLSFQWTSGDEWTLLIESPRTGQRWTVWEVRISFTYLGARLQERMLMEGSITRKQRLSVEAGEFDTFVVDYMGRDELDGTEIVEPFPIETLCLAPNVGMVQFAWYDDEGEATTVAKLVKYEKVSPLLPNEPPVVEVLGPAEGDILSKDHEIRWTATDPDGDEIELNIQYGKDTGPWVNIPFDGVNDGSLIWDTTAVPDGSHKIRITASDGKDETTVISGELVIDNTPPSKVSNLAGVEHQVRQWSAKGRISVRWSPAIDAGTGLDGYSTAWDTVPNRVPEPVKNMEEMGTSASSIDLVSGDNYYFHIRAVDNTGNWGETEHLGPFYIDKTFPGEVTKLSSPSHEMGVYSSDDTVDVAWMAADDWGSGLKGYSVVWDTNAETLPDETQDIDGNVTGLSSDPLSEGVDHYFHIRSVDNIGNWSVTAVHTGPFKIDITPPTLVSNLTSPSHNPEEWSSTPVVQLAWESATDALSGLQGYSVVWNSSSDTIPDDTVEVAADVTSYSDAKLSDGKTHYFHVRSVDNAGNASAEAVHTGAFYIDITGPELVTGLASPSHQVDVWSNDDTVDVQWVSAVDALSGLDGYSVSWDDTVPGDVKTIEEDAVALTSPELVGGTSFYFRIKGVDNLGNWGEDARIGPFLIDTINPSEVADLNSITHNTSEWSSIQVVRVTWTSAQDNESGLAGYSALWDTSSDTLPEATMNLSADVTEFESQELADGDSIYFHIRSADKAGNWSDTATHLGPFKIDPTLPTLVSNLTSPTHNPEEWSSTQVVQLTWESATDTLSGLQGYSVLWDSSPDTIPDDTVEVGADVTSYSDAKLSDGKTHYFHVRSVDNAGNVSVEAVHIGAFYIDTTGPELVTDLASPSHQVDVWSDDDTVDVQWVSAVDALSGLDGYSVSWDDTVPGDVKTIEEDAVALTSPQLTDGTSFYFRIKGVDNLGNWGEDARIGPFLIDTINPSEVADLNSITHNTSEWSSIQVVKVTWTSAQDNESGLAGYSALWDSSSDTLPEATMNLGADVTESESQELADGDSIYFHIRSADKAGNWSDIAIHLGPFYVDATAPTLALPDVEEVWSNENIVTVNTGAADEFSGLKGYSVVWDEMADTEPEEVENAAAAETVDSPELADGKWYLHAKALDNAGNWSAASHTGPFMIDTNNIQPPGDLASNTHVPGVWNENTVIEVSWTSAVDDLSGLSGYSVEWDNQPDTIPDTVKELEADAVSIMSPEMPDGDNIWFHIRSIDNAGNGDRGQVHFGPFYVDSSAPGSVANLTAPVGEWTTDNILKLEWEPAVDAGVGLGGYSFVLDSAPETMPPQTKNLDPEVTNWTSTLLRDGTYYFHIRSVDKVNTWSDTAEHSGPFQIDTTPPTVPTNLRSTSHSVRTWSRQNTVNVSWQASTDGMSGVAGYSISWDNSPSALPDETADLDGSRTSAVSSRLADRDNHYFHIRAVDEAGNWSNAVDLGPFYVDSTPPANVRVQRITQDSGTQYTHLVGTNLHYSALSSAAFTVYVSGTDTGSGLKEAVFADCVCPGATVTDESAGPEYSYSYQYMISQTSNFDGRATVTVYDNAGNSGTASFNVTYDNVGPNTPTNLQCDNGAEWNTTGEVTITWGGEGDDKSGVVDYYVEPGVEKPEKNPSGGKQTITLSVDDAEAVTFYVRGMDNVGNWGEAASATIGVDTKAPGKASTIEHSDSDANPGYDNDKQMDFSWQPATDNIRVDHYEVHLSVDGDDYKLHESTDEDGYTLSANDGESCSIKVVAVDAAGNKGDMSEPSETIVCDATMPGFTVAMIPNPGFYNFMDIGIVCSEKLLEEAPSLSVDLGGQAEIDLKNVAENVWVGSYTISVGASGTGVLTVSGTDLAGNEETDTSNSFSAQTVLAKAPARIESSDGKLNLDIPSGAFDRDTVITITPAATNASLIQNLGSANLAPGLDSAKVDELEQFGRQYLVWPKDVDLLTNATLTMRYDGNLSGKRVGIYRWDSSVSEWEYVDSLVDEKSGTVSALIGRFGIFGLYIDARVPQISRMSPPDGAVLDTSLPEFTARINDNGSGVDLSSLSLVMDGETVAIDRRYEGDLVVLTLKDGLTAGSHTFFISGSDLAGNVFTSRKHIIHVPLWAVIPEVTELLQNYPNPFNPETWIPYKLSEPSEVELRIYSISGQLVRVLRLGQCKPGTYTDKNRAIYWDGKNENGEAVSSGIYFYHLTAGKSTSVRKMVVAR